MKFAAAILLVSTASAASAEVVASATPAATYGATCAATADCTGSDANACCATFKVSNAAYDADVSAVTATSTLCVPGTVRVDTVATTTYNDIGKYQDSTTSGSEVYYQWDCLVAATETSAFSLKAASAAAVATAVYML